MKTYEGICWLTKVLCESYESSGASPFSVFRGKPLFSIDCFAIPGKVGRRRLGHSAECATGRWCADANFARVRFALGLLADRPMQSS